MNKNIWIRPSLILLLTVPHVDVGADKVCQAVGDFFGHDGYSLKPGLACACERSGDTMQPS